MSFADEYGPFIVLGAGIALLSMAGKRKPRKMDDHSGKPCSPDDEDIPEGYECVRVEGEFVLQREQSQFIGYGPYPNQEAIENLLVRLGFGPRDLKAFQEYTNYTTTWELAATGRLNRQTILALQDAERMLERGEWIGPEG